MEDKTKRNASIIKDADGNNIVMINDICFKGKRNVNWEDVSLRYYRYKKRNEQPFGVLRLYSVPNPFLIRIISQTEIKSRKMMELRKEDAEKFADYDTEREEAMAEKYGRIV